MRKRQSKGRSEKCEERKKGRRAGGRNGTRASKNKYIYNLWTQAKQISSKIHGQSYSYFSGDFTLIFYNIL